MRGRISRPRRSRWARRGPASVCRGKSSRPDQTDLISDRLRTWDQAAVQRSNRRPRAATQTWEADSPRPSLLLLGSGTKSMAAFRGPPAVGGSVHPSPASMSSGHMTQWQAARPTPNCDPPCAGAPDGHNHDYAFISRGSRRTLWVIQKAPRDCGTASQTCIRLHRTSW